MVIRLAAHYGMRALLHDRYVVTAPDRACDLATGAELSLEAVESPAAQCVSPDLSALFDALDHGREGEPQRVTLRTGDGIEPRAHAEAIAVGAQQRGYVPVAVSLYAEAREALKEELRDRAIVLIDADAGRFPANACLLHAAAGSSRPHMLVVLGQARSSWSVVREAHATFGVMAGRPRAVPHPEVARLVARAGKASEFVLAGRHAAAERLLREVVAALQRRRACSEAAWAAISLGRMLLERGRAVEADTCCGEAAHLAEMDGDGIRCCEARLTQSWARLEQVRIVEAESIARAVLIAAPDAETTACARATLARCLLEQGRTRELMALETDAGRPGRPGSYWNAILHDVWVAVLVETGRLFEAGQRIRAALDESQACAEPLPAAILHTAHLRVVVATGDTHLATDVLRRALGAARRARAPLRGLRARVVMCAGVARAGAPHLVEAEVRRLRRLLRVAPPMLSREVDIRPRAQALRGLAGADSVNGDIAATLLVLAQEDDDGDAVRAVLTFASKTLDACRLDVVSRDAGPETVVLSVGSGPASRLGARVLECGLGVGFGQGAEAGVPLRCASRLIGALVARWSLGRTPPDDRRAILECAAAVIAPRIEAMQLRAREASAASVEVPELVGVGAATLELRRAVLRAARAPFSVLIQGESGVGKELVARAIHQLSQRRERRFCDINCAALPDELFETELFGHAKGAFTGALAERAGLFEEASGGTLFLDEVADLSLRAQAKLLRAVQQQEVRRVGESFARPVDVRFVAAANRQMAAEVESGRFRADLLYRLDVIHIHIPPLRERPEDIPVIAEHLWQQTASRVGSTARLAPGALAALAHYAWPGNVRELQNVLAALAVTAPPRGRVRASLLPPVISAASGVSAGQLAPARDQFERRFIEMALARAGGNRSRAARALGLSRQGLLKCMSRLGLRPDTVGEHDAPRAV